MQGITNPYGNHNNAGFKQNSNGSDNVNRGGSSGSNNSENNENI